jgi:hypothetical protein
MSNTINPLSMVAAAPSTGSKPGKSDNWFEAMAEAWGQTLDKTATSIESMSEDISNGNDKPAAITALSAESLKMSFLSSSSHTALSSVGSALETMARKQ